MRPLLVCNRGVIISQKWYHIFSILILIRVHIHVFKNITCNLESQYEDEDE